MNEQNLDEVLKQLRENQEIMKSKLNDALFNTTDEDEKKQILDMIILNEKVEIAIANKDLITLQKLYTDANIN